jgi:hypothetical protein
MTSKFATPLAINCSIIICHSTSSIPVEAKYQPPLKDFLIMGGSSLEALISMFNITLSAIAFADPRPPHASLLRSRSPRFLFLARGAGARGDASMRAGTSHPATGRRALAFKENQIIHVNRCNKININIMKDIHRKTHFIS